MLFEFTKHNIIFTKQHNNVGWLDWKQEIMPWVYWGQKEYKILTGCKVVVLHSAHVTYADTPLTVNNAV